ncbi:hypothetical protein HBH53_004370 [Parastagonospora nodorum]|nr:hypothetical protein HBH53_004370 [Parastagonospora nodorum]KAH4607289.1 hypothetical protein HBH82_090680 [Parastagonospora nodorum]KAH4710703.1 hypothetical protein HBH67_032600 [Parastagonospora nodorum]KAH4715142.1 hypothetical protein HBH78_035630 [Parastagonospora nodorum]KAH4784376.1 hypothetical protein HBH62_092610 [Parastagonospora nodorum]
MVDVWSGDILLSDGNTIKDVGLALPHVASSPILQFTSLRFLTTVETAKIPLYLAAGPSLDVWTTCEATEAWFESILLSKPAGPCEEANHNVEGAWWTLARSQSPIGILVQAQGSDEEGRKPRVTEILFYGTIAAPPAAVLPTPPSSSPEHDDAGARQLPELRVHALPLSSDLLYQQASTIVTLALPAPAGNDAAQVEAQFIAPQADTQQAPDSPKRKRDIFEAATIANKKARGKGGAGIAAIAARGSESQSSLGHRKSFSGDTKPSTEFRPSSANGPLSRPTSRQLSRSPSISSDTRPLSRKGVQDGQTKRSNLSRVATVSLQAEEPTTESRNKEALSRVVMAAMRMHGWQQRKKNRSYRASVAPGTEESQEIGVATVAEEAAKDEEYKLMYHQTYKGAAFAFRMHIMDRPLHAQPDQMRDVVEKLLAIYLNDPLAQPVPTAQSINAVATPGAKARLGVLETGHSQASPFDLPSSKRPGMMRSKTDPHAYTGSPVSRRKVGQSEAPPT